VNQAGEEQDHVSALVHDGTVAVGAANLAGKLVLDRLGAGVVPLEVMVSVREVDVLLVEDGSPLERCSWKCTSVTGLECEDNDKTYHAESGKWCSGTAWSQEAPLCSAGT